MVVNLAPGALHALRRSLKAAKSQKWNQKVSIYRELLQQWKQAGDAEVGRLHTHPVREAGAHPPEADGPGRSAVGESGVRVGIKLSKDAGSGHHRGYWHTAGSRDGSSAAICGTESGESAWDRLQYLQQCLESDDEALRPRGGASSSQAEPAGMDIAATADRSLLLDRIEQLVVKRATNPELLLVTLDAFSAVQHTVVMESRRGHLAMALQRHIAALSPNDLTRALRAAERIGIKLCEQSTTAIVDHILQQAEPAGRAGGEGSDGWDVGVLATCCESLTAMGPPPVRLLNFTAFLAMHGVAQLSTAVLAQLLQACAKAGHRPTRFIDAFIQDALTSNRQLSKGELAAIVCALAELQQRDSLTDVFLSALAEDSLPCMLAANPSLTASELASLVWSYATLSHPGLSDARLLDSILLRLSRGAEELQPSSQIQLVQALAAMDAHHPTASPALLNAIAARVSRSVACLPAPALVSLLHALAQLRHHHSGLFAAVGVAVAQLPPPQQLPLHGMLELVWAFVHVSEPPPQPLVDSLVACADLEEAPELSAGDVCRLVWTLTVLERMTAERFERLVQPLSGRWVMQPAELQLLYQAKLLLQAKLQQQRRQPQAAPPDEGVAEQEWVRGTDWGVSPSTPPATGIGSGTCCGPRLPPDLDWRARRAHQDRVARCSNVSSFQQEVCRTLLELRIPHHMEASLADIMMVDMMTQYSGHRVVVEVDGSRRFTSNAPHRPTGDTRVRNALLQWWGWPLVTISKHEWKKLTTAQQRRDHLRQLFEESIRRSHDGTWSQDAAPSPPDGASARPTV